MMKFEIPEIKVIKFATPDILTLSADASYEGVKQDHVFGSDDWDFEETYML